MNYVCMWKTRLWSFIMCSISINELMQFINSSGEGLLLQNSMCRCIYGILITISHYNKYNITNTITICLCVYVTCGVSPSLMLDAVMLQETK